MYLLCDALLGLDMESTEVRALFFGMDMESTEVQALLCNACNGYGKH